MKKDEFNRLFDSAFEDAAKDLLPEPNPNPSWSKIEPILKRRLSRKKNRLLPYVIAASCLIGAIMLGSPTVTKALNPIVQTIKQIQTGVVSFIFGNDIEQSGEAKTVPPPEEAGSNEGKSVDSGVLTEQNYKTWEEALPHLSFTAPTIRYIPEHFILSDVIVFSNEGHNAKKAVLLYTYTYENESKSYMVTIRMLEENETVTSGSDLNGGQYEKVQINGQPGFLFLTKDARSSLEYMLGNTLISIAGALSKDEILEIAKNIR